MSSLLGINFCSVFELCAHIKTLRAPFVALRVIPVSTTTPPAATAAAGGSRVGVVGVAVAAHSTTQGTHACFGGGRPRPLLNFAVWEAGLRGGQPGTNRRGRSLL